MEKPTWWLDEVGTAGREHLDPAFVASYDDKSGTEWDEDVETLQQLGVGATSTVVDMGAGTGSFALAIAPLVGRVVAVDISDAMVSAMRARGIDAVRGGFLTYEHEGDPADVVFTRNALHQLPDFWKVIALEHMHDLLRPGGVLLLRDLVYSFDSRHAEAAIARWLDSAPIDPRTGWTAAELAEHVRDEYSTFTWLLDSMLDRAGFDIHTREVHETGMYAYYTCIRRA